MVKIAAAPIRREVKGQSVHRERFQCELTSLRLAVGHTNRIYLALAYLLRIINNHAQKRREITIFFFP